MKISIGSDHGGFALKTELVNYLREEGREVKDVGCYSTDPCDYPQFAKAVAADVVSGEADLGIVVCTTGIGVSIAANKVHGIRCALCHNEHTAQMTKLHNNANVLALGAAELTPVLAKRITDIFLDTPFSGEEKHVRRVSQLEEA